MANQIGTGTSKQDIYLATSVNELKKQMNRLFVYEKGQGQAVEDHFGNAQEEFPLLFPKGDPNGPHPVFADRIGEVAGSARKSFPVRNPEVLRQYKEQMKSLAARMDQEINSATKDKGEAGQTLATITKARSSNIIKNALNGWNSYRIGHEIGLYRILGDLPDQTNYLSSGVLNDIEGSKEAFPIYEATAKGYEAVQTTVDYLDAKEKGTLTAEKENDLRADLYRQLSAAKADLDVIKELIPGTEAYQNSNINMSVTRAGSFTYGVSGGIRNVYADVEARLAGVKNGWPIEDLSALAMFNSVRHSMISHAYYNADGELREQPHFRSEEEREFIEQMNAMFEKLDKTPVLDYARRQALLDEMSGVLQAGIGGGVIDGDAVNNTAARIRQQGSVKLSAAANERLGIDAQGKRIVIRDENANLVYAMRYNVGNMGSGGRSVLSQEDTARFEEYQEELKLDYDHPDLEKYDGWMTGKARALKGPIGEMHIAGLFNKGISEDGQPYDNVEKARRFNAWMREKYQQRVDELGALEEPAKSRYAKLREYYELCGKFCDMDGISMEAGVRAPYLSSLQARTTGFINDQEYSLDEIMKALDQDPENPIFDAYMDITSSGLREAVVEFRRQEMERRGFTKKDESVYLRELRQEHEKTIAAYDRIWNTKDEGQYDKYLGNRLETVCGKRNPNQRDISFMVGQLRGEVRGIDNGWGYKDVHLFGFIGGVEQEIARYREQLNAEMKNKLAKIQEAGDEKDLVRLEEKMTGLTADLQAIAARQAELTTLAEDFKAVRDRAWNTRVQSNMEKAAVMEDFDAFVKRHPNARVLNQIVNPYNYAIVYQDKMKECRKAAATEAYERLRDCLKIKDYATLTQMLTQIENGSLFPGQPQEVRDAADRFLTELASPGPDGLVPSENAEILGRIAGQAGTNLIDPMLKKADELTQMEDKVLKGQVPGTETLLDYQGAGLGDNREMIRDVVNNYVDQTSAAAKDERATRGLLTKLNALTQAAGAQPLFLLGDGQKKLSDYINECADDGMSFGKYKGGLTEQEYKEKFERASEKVNDISKHGFEIDPNAKEGENIFSKMPEDVKSIQQATSAQEVEQTYNKALDDSLWIAAYRLAVAEAAAAAGEQLERLEKMKQSSNSAEYTAMHDALKNLADLGKEGEIDKKTPAQIEKAFEDLKTAGAAYERTHKGWFKGNIGTGRQRYQFSGEIQGFAQDKIDTIRRNAQGIDPNRAVGQQIMNRSDAVKRSKNASIAQAQVKDVNLGNLEKKLGGNAGKPRIDYAALRAKMNRMQQVPQKQGPVRGGMSA